LCHELLRDARFFRTLQRFDEDLASQTRAAGCACGGVLHSARYPRKPRGGPDDLGPAYRRRLSFCCARDGCRRRMTPPSLRFLGRRVYLGAVVVLVAAMRGGVTAQRAGRLEETVGVSVRTLERWRRWWRETFVRSALWKGLQGRFVPPPDVGAFPASLLARFAGRDARERLLRMLWFLAPLTTRSPFEARILTGGPDPQRMRFAPTPSLP